MASIRKLPSGKWNVRITRIGFPTQTKTFISRVDADRWARSTESEMDRGSFVCRSKAESITLGAALERYMFEVTPHKKGSHQETKRIRQWLKSDLAKCSLASLKGADFAKYRDSRLAAGRASNSVRLELAIVSHLFTIARKEWDIPVDNPVKDIRKPKVSNARSRRLEGDEEARLFRAVGHKKLRALITLALETGMRQSELVSLTWQEIDLEKSIIKKADSKNGEARVIPLTTKAKAALGDRGIGRLFTCFPRQAWNDAVKAAGLIDFKFHDLRHEAVSRLFELGMNPMEVSAVSGHKTLQMLKRYTHLKPADLLMKMEQVS